MPSERNRRLLEEVSASLSRCTIAITTNCSGLPVSAVNGLRRRLREQGVEYKVVKNTLTLIAGKATGKEGIAQVMEGPTAIAFGFGDPVVPARALDEFIRVTRSPLQVRGAIINGRVLQAPDVLRLAGLPPREVLLAQLGGGLRAPIQRLVSALSSPIGGLVTVLQRRVEQAQA